MKEKSESITAADFFEKLQHDKLDTTVPFSIIGMVKKSEGKEKAIEFAPGGNCSNWVTIPLEFIEDVEVLKTIACKDHSHPLVKLNMKSPETTEGKILFALLGAMQAMKDSIEVQTYGYNLPPSKLSSPKMTPRIRRPRGFGGFGNDLGLSVGSRMDYNCSEHGCTCSGLFDCIQMCWETDSCWHGRCVESGGIMFCPWG